jgi:transcription antitermination factor NusG
MNVEDPCYQSQKRWFAVRVKSNREKIIASMVQNKDVEAFLPLYNSRRRWSDRVVSVELPLFTGYVFCRLNPDHRMPILTIPGVLHFVGVGKTPMPIDDSEIGAIGAALRCGLWAEPWPFLEVGQRVRLDHGPLQGVEGFLVEANKRNRVVVSVTLLKRSVAVEIERDWVTPLDGKGRDRTIRVNTSPGMDLPCHISGAALGGASVGTKMSFAPANQRVLQAGR